MRHVILLTALLALALPAIASADDGGADAPPELIPPQGCDYSAGGCSIVIDPETDTCMLTRARVWVGRDGVWTIINWMWGDRPDLDAAIRAADDQFTRWIVNGDIASLNTACGFAAPEDAPSVPEPGPEPTTPDESPPSDDGASQLALQPGTADDAPVGQKASAPIEDGPPTVFLAGLSVREVSSRGVVATRPPGTPNSLRSKKKAKRPTGAKLGQDRKPAVSARPFRGPRGLHLPRRV